MAAIIYVESLVAISISSMLRSIFSIIIKGRIGASQMTRTPESISPADRAKIIPP